ncbi:hypothetical protein BDZ91DRAFT_417739 [Kalaharituber pfeilii]|nr:hypothetical protein BDZ91DRAFT_417739 [Kalaharituber pfeilii]
MPRYQPFVILPCPSRVNLLLRRVELLEHHGGFSNCARVRLHRYPVLLLWNPNALRIAFFFSIPLVYFYILFLLPLNLFLPQTFSPCNCTLPINSFLFLFRKQTTSYSHFLEISSPL